METVPTFDPGPDNRVTLADLERRLLVLVTTKQGLYSAPSVCLPAPAGVWAPGTWTAGMPGSYIQL